MSRRAARFTQTEVSRAIRAADKASPPRTVEIGPDGVIRLVPSNSPPPPPQPDDLGKDIVL